MKMNKNDSVFYEKNAEFVLDMQEIIITIENELKYILNQISGNKIKEKAVHIAMIPFLPDVSGFLVSTQKSGLFKCNNIREFVGDSLDCKEISNLERDRYYEIDDEWNIRKCEIYSRSLEPFPFIRRYGSTPNTRNQDEIYREMIEILKKNKEKLEAVFISGWIHFGPFLIMLITEIDNEYYLDYRMRAKANESCASDYQYFLDTVIENFHAKWLEYIYYGLSYSTINFISSGQAIIQASANDMFGSRRLSEEYLFTQISNIDYEGSACNGKIVFTDKLEDINEIIRFSKPITLENGNVKKIRKMLEMTGGKKCLIASMSQKRIIGIDTIKDKKGLYTVEFIGKNMWQLLYEDVCIIKYIMGQYRLPEILLNEHELNAKLIENFGNQYNPSIIEIIKEATKQKHGTMVVISKNAKTETEAIIKEGKGISINEVNLLKVDKELIMGLCSIDGAIMIDSYGCCKGIGLILSNPSGGEGNPERGARYNSALNYVNNHKSSIAVVISEDGMVDVLCSSNT